MYHTLGNTELEDYIRCGEGECILNLVLPSSQSSFGDYAKMGITAGTEQGHSHCLIQNCREI
jgi:hypothetical protein